MGRPARCMISTSAHGRARHEIGGFDHHGIAIGQRRGDLPGRNGDGEIPRRDQADDAQRFARDLDVDAGAHRREFLAGHPQAFAGRRTQRSGRRARLRRRLPAASCLPRATAAGRVRPCGPGFRPTPSSGCRSAACGVDRDHAGNAALAAAIAASACARVPRTASPTMSLVSDGLTFGARAPSDNHSPSIRLLNISMGGFSTVTSLSGSRVRGIERLSVRWPCARPRNPSASARRLRDRGRGSSGPCALPR